MNGKAQLYHPLTAENAALVLVDHQVGRLRSVPLSPVITAIDKGYDAWLPSMCPGTFSNTKPEAGLLRMQQAGLIVSDNATLMVELLKDNGGPEAAAVCGALDMPWATLVGQVFEVYSKQSAQRGEPALSGSLRRYAFDNGDQRNPG